MAQREFGELPASHADRGVFLPLPQTADLGADESPVGDVVMPQRRRGGIAGELGVPVQKHLGQPGRAEPFQVHGQKGHVVKTVEEAEPFVELQAVQNPRPVVQAEDVLGEQVTVAVHDAALADAGREQRFAAVEETQREPFDLGDDLGVENRIRERANLIEARAPARPQRLRSSLLIDLRAVRGPPVHARDHPGDLTQGLLNRFPRADHDGETAFLGHAPHHDEMLADLSIRADHIGDPLVDIRGQPPVELHLLRGRRPAGASRVVKSRKPIFTGFLSLKT